MKPNYHVTRISLLSESLATGATGVPDGLFAVRKVESNDNPVSPVNLKRLCNFDHKHKAIHQNREE